MVFKDHQAYVRVTFPQLIKREDGNNLEEMKYVHQRVISRETTTVALESKEVVFGYVPLCTGF